MPTSSRISRLHWLQLLSSLHFIVAFYQGYVFNHELLFTNMFMSDPIKSKINPRCHTIAFLRFSLPP
ncbi:unnamed protein product [Cuscuta epithymum]|uniref:Secreted protein n=1 Tax=Cuscuta epithymum TaxID=186058 RepID=A0AAV0F3E9_9ASTE|nr:unnamed protein product [Cuscuta epithymum]